MICLTPFAHGGAAMSFHVEWIDQNVGGRSASLIERLEQADPNTLGRSAHGAVVEHLPRHLHLAPCVSPMITGLQPVDDAVDHASIVHPFLAPA